MIPLGMLRSKQIGPQPVDFTGRKASKSLFATTLFDQIHFLEWLDHAVPELGLGGRLPLGTEEVKGDFSDMALSVTATFGISGKDHYTSISRVLLPVPPQ